MSHDIKKTGRKDAKKDKSLQAKDKAEDAADNSPVKAKYGPSITFPYQKVWSRCVLILGVLFVVWYNNLPCKEIYLAKQKDILVSRTQKVECSEKYMNDVNKYYGCIPDKCGRVVSDKLISAAETDALLRIATNGLNLGGSEGGASILDLHSGALSKGRGFINMYKLPALEKTFTIDDFTIYKVVKTKIQHAIAHNFGVDIDQIYLTKPTFFSRITNATAKTIHDEYWHPHVDKDTYKSFHFTSLLYLSDYGRDFEGGRFILIDKKNLNATIEPRKGRVSMFTSGSENLHAVEKVTSGTRYALTVSFTCDVNAAISDPSINNILKK